MTSSLIGTWDLEASENFDDFLKSLGVGILTRKAANMVKPTMVVEKLDDASWRVTIKTNAKTSETTFKDGIEFEEGIQKCFYSLTKYLYI